MVVSVHQGLLTREVLVLAQVANSTVLQPAKTVLKIATIALMIPHVLPVPKDTKNPMEFAFASWELITTQEHVALAYHTASHAQMVPLAIYVNLVQHP